ncbi:hypothetical protein YB2330_002940 [Saitoella coloradoensis]
MQSLQQIGRRSAVSGFATGSFFSTTARLGERVTPQAARAARTKGGRLPLRRKGFMVAGATLMGAAGLTVVSNPTDNALKQGAIAVQRSARVAVACVLCFNDYRRVLNSEYLTSELREEAMSACHKKCALRTRKVMEKNGGVYIKLGQHVSAMAYLIPIEWVEAMIPLQDRAPASSYESVRAMIEGDTGEKFEDIFKEFDEVPLGVASLAQVHRAVLRKDGQEVAVKLQHPEIAAYSRIDVSVTSFVLDLIQRAFPEFTLGWLGEEMREHLPRELDFTLEAENAINTQKYFAKIKGSPLKVPDVVWSQQRILVMEFIRGGRLDDLAFIDSNGIDRNQVSLELANVFNEMIFGGARLHADPHAGNLLIRRKPTGSKSRQNFEIVLLDHGLYRDIPLQARRDYAHLWLAILERSEPDIAKYAKIVAGIDDYKVFVSAITARDWDTVMAGVETPRSADEFKRINTAVGQGLVMQIIDMLHRVPRRMLYLFKTQDLVRALDESLKTTLSPERLFLNMTRYCATAVFGENLDRIWGEWSTGRGWVWAMNEYIRVYFGYWFTQGKIMVLERLM